jgi:hypothetical protein
MSIKYKAWQYRVCLLLVLYYTFGAILVRLWAAWTLVSKTNWPRYIYLLKLITLEFVRFIFHRFPFSIENETNSRLVSLFPKRSEHRFFFTIKFYECSHFSIGNYQQELAKDLAQMPILTDTEERVKMENDVQNASLMFCSCWIAKSTGKLKL